MTPADTVDHELVDFLSSALQEPAVVLTVIVRLVLRSCTLLLLASFLVDVGVFTLVVVTVDGGQHADHRLKQEQDVVEAMDLELFEESPSQVLLVAELLDEGALLVNALQIFHHADLLPAVDLLVVIQQLVHDLFEHALLRCIL